MGNNRRQQTAAAAVSGVCIAQESERWRFDVQTCEKQKMKISSATYMYEGWLSESSQYLPQVVIIKPCRCPKRQNNGDRRIAADLVLRAAKYCEMRSLNRREAEAAGPMSGTVSSA